MLPHLHVFLALHLLTFCMLLLLPSLVWLLLLLLLLLLAAATDALHTAACASCYMQQYMQG